MQSPPDGPFDFLLKYQDHGIKLYEKRELQSKSAKAVADTLVDISTFIWAPAMLQTDNGRELTGQAGNSSASVVRCAQIKQTSNKTDKSFTRALSPGIDGYPTHI